MNVSSADQFLCTNVFTHLLVDNFTIFSDHAGGNEKLAAMVTGLTVCGNDDRIGAMNKRVNHNDQFQVTCQCLKIILLLVSCHDVCHSDTQHID